MPRLIPHRLVAVCALAFAFLLCIASSAAASGVPASLRVIGSGGKILAEKELKTGTTSVPTSPKATCFGKGTGGSGKPVKIPGATALGLLGQAARSTASLRPLLISDAFDFGLALCGIGDEVAKGTSSWYLKVNHKNPEVGGEAVKLKGGDEVLWYLAPSYPYPDELVLQAPRRVAAGTPFEVRVFAFDDEGHKEPAAGVAVTGATDQTGGDGRATVVLNKPRTLIARGAKLIPSNREPVCVNRACPEG